jgi:hypothetical protein
MRFETLTDAVHFLAQALNAGDDEALAGASREELPAWVLKRLTERPQQTPLPQLYAGREFPDAADEFKLVGHGSELGPIHIDFVRAADGWQLRRIWMCR